MSIINHPDIYWFHIYFAHSMQCLQCHVCCMWYQRGMLEGWGLKSSEVSLTGLTDDVRNTQRAGGDYSWGFWGSSRFMHPLSEISPAWQFHSHRTSYMSAAKACVQERERAKWEPIIFLDLALKYMLLLCHMLFVELLQRFGGISALCFKKSM